MIKVFDAVMGSGKTTHIIEHMNNNQDQKYIYITPNLSECVRIQNACPDLNFIQPSDNNKKNTKLKDLEKLVEEEKNIASTHALLTYFTQDTLELLKNRDYHLILDEAIEPCVKHNLTTTDINIMFDSGYVGLDDDGITLKWLKEKPLEGFKYYREYKLIENSSLVSFDFNHKGSSNKVFIWELTKGLFESFTSVTILTYQFEGSILRAYMDLKRISYEVDTKTLDRSLKLGHLIQIHDEESLNKIGNNLQSLGARSLKRDKNTKCKELGKNMYNFFNNKCSSRSSNSLWTTFKEVENHVSPKGYKKSFLSHTTKATNDYAHCDTLAYGLNKFMDVPLKKYLMSQGVEVNEDLWALNEMLQWIFRSAIRKGKPIKIYVPSRRMRELLLEWSKNN